MPYVKFHSPWSTADKPTGRALNWIESQWDYIKADADAHSHDSRYYTKTLSDATFFSLTTSVSLGMDADLLDGNHYSDLLASVMPIGAIMIWAGTDATVPSGWHICDGGTYGGLASPDLRDRFIMGAGDTYAAGDTGGPATWNGTITPTGTVTVGDHTLTTAELPAHNHTFTEKTNDATSWGSYTNYYNTVTQFASSRSTNILEQAVGGGAHGHTGSTAAFSGVDPRPKYYSLYYIMKYM